ncbi:MAG: hypothetical protein AAB539_03840 [Patescibacteria group bacterium]
MARQRVRIVFRGTTKDEAFGAFCQALIEGDVPFDIAGHRQVFMSERVRANLGGKPVHLLDEYIGSGVAEQTTVEITGRRVIRSSEEGLKIARQYMDKRRQGA